MSMRLLLVAATAIMMSGATAGLGPAAGAAPSGQAGPSLAPVGATVGALAPADDPASDDAVGDWTYGGGVIRILPWTSDAFQGRVLKPLRLRGCTYSVADDLIWTMHKIGDSVAYEGEFFPRGGPNCAPADTLRAHWIIGTPGSGAENRNLLTFAADGWAAYRFTRVVPAIKLISIRVRRGPTPGQPSKVDLTYEAKPDAVQHTLVVTDLTIGSVVGRAKVYHRDPYPLHRISATVAGRARPDHRMTACVTSASSFGYPSKTACVHYAANLLPNNKWFTLSRR